jgi:hypothetical protein
MGNKDSVKGNISAEVLDRLEEFLDKKGDAVTSLAKQVGVSYAYFSSTRRMGSELGLNKIIKILQLYPDLSPDWLLLGAGLMIRNSSLHNIDKLLERDKQLRELHKDLTKMQKQIADMQTKIGADTQAKIVQEKAEKVKKVKKSRSPKKSS